MNTRFKLTHAYLLFYGEILSGSLAKDLIKIDVCFAFSQRVANLALANFAEVEPRPPYRAEERDRSQLRKDTPQPHRTVRNISGPWHFDERRIDGDQHRTAVPKNLHRPAFHGEFQGAEGGAPHHLPRRT